MAPRNQIVTDDVKWSRDGKRHVTNGHVTENVTWPWQVEVVTPICWAHYLRF